ncbi:putative bifunctional diguanylate cyclase/phosphodiesterase [Pseudochrobactrum kiredjianiae]|uniref:Bifunctional diguanylate cyclase/phosphodiesterase n=1 Tax=Pseudochrobactrum kiredjianiae TaxID=386305 RepID=A0ABW3UYH0_9HYPH|nr:EAL domain-containing protein [Pseudochrobactrum kiredjianiae]MDM7852462.1 EAL domain-containing protein [Pseudochrobactrum kiredjianiae]
MNNSSSGSYNARIQRLQLACRQALPAAVLVSGIWIPVFAFFQHWHLVVLEAVLSACIIFSWMLVRRGAVTTGMIIAQAVCIAFIVIFSTLFDIPSPDIPRVSHLYLLLIALAGYVNFQRVGGKVQLSLIVTSLALFIIFSSTSFNSTFARPLPDETRFFTSWVHACFVTILLCIGFALVEDELSEDRKFIGDFRQAINNGQFELLYQPQVDESGNLIGAEALIRWNHPQKGIIRPDSFIPVAERTGFMPELGNWVLDNALNTLAHWRNDVSTRHLTMAVNVSPDHFLETDFAINVIRKLKLLEIAPSNLKLELTEGMFVSEVDDLVEKMNVLKSAGVGLALDDFGTGYSSLSYLRRLPFDQLKIDRSFVLGITEGKRGESLAKSITQMGIDLDLQMLAEGIETNEQFQFMLSCGCTAFQGYHFDRPISLEDFIERVKLYPM